MDLGRHIWDTHYLKSQRQVFTPDPGSEAWKAGTTVGPGDREAAGRLRETAVS